jgi:prophage tail gpP-like protein
VLLEKVSCSGLPPIKSCTISISAEEASRTASLDLVVIGTGMPVSIGRPVTLVASGTTLLTGYVRDVNPSHDAESRTLSVNLVSRTIDYVECSADHPSGEILNKDILAIAKELDAYGIGVESDGSFPKEPRHKLEPGESAFSSIERRCRGRGVLIHDTEKGRLKLSTKPSGTHSGGLIYGRNILAGSASFTEQGRYSKVKVRGQAAEGVEKPQLRGETSVDDSGVERKRVLIVPHEGEVTTDRMAKRAEWQAKRAAGNGSTASITVSGWRDDAGKIWTPNWLVQVEDALLGLSGLMVIKSVSLTQNDRTEATLSLADPRALGGENPRGKSAAGYAAPGAIKASYGDE